TAATSANTSTPDSTPYTIPYGIAALSSGTIFYTASPVDVAFTELLAYYPAAGFSSVITGPGVPFGSGKLLKKPDGSGFIWWADLASDLWLYANGGFTAHVNLSVQSAVFSPDGTRILVNGHILLDSNLQQVADLRPSLQPGFLPAYSKAAFSWDGSRVYA